MLNSISDSEHCQLNFTIHLAARRTVIGPRGRTIKAISKQNNVSIKVKRKLRRREYRFRFRNELEFIYFGLPTNYRAYYIDVDVLIEGMRNGCEEAKAEVLELAEEGASNVFVAEEEFEFPRKDFLIKEVQQLKTRYPELFFWYPDFRFQPQTWKIHIKGSKPRVLEAAEELKRVHARIMEETAILTVKIPGRLWFMLQDISEDIYQDTFVESTKEGITICGIVEKAQAVKAALLEVASSYITEVIELPIFIPGNSPENRQIFDQLWARVLGPKYFCTVEVLFEEPYLEIRGKREFVRSFKEVMTTTIERVLPENVTIIPGDYRRIRDYDRTSEIERFAQANEVLCYLGEENVCLIDLATGEVEEAFESSVEAVKNLLFKWKEVLESLETKTDDVGLGRCGGLKSPTSFDVLQKRSWYLSAKEKTEKMKEDVVHERTVMVPSKFLTGLIGKDRRSWREIKVGYCVNLKILDQGKGTRSKQLMDEKSETPIVISGFGNDVNRAATGIFAKVKHLSSCRAARMQIDAIFHKRIAGYNYCHRNRIEYEHWVDIRFPRSDLRHPCPKHEDEIVVHGRSASVTKAKKDILEIYRWEKDAAKQKTIDVPLSMPKEVRQLLGDRLYDRSDKKHYKGVKLLRKFPCVGVDYEMKEEEGIATATVYGTEEALSRIPENLKRLKNMDYTATISVPTEYHDNFDSDERIKIMKAAGVEDLSEEQKLNLIQIPETGLEVKCSGEKLIVEIVAELIRERVEGWELSDESYFNGRD